MGTRSLYDVQIVFWSSFTLLFHMLICLGTNGFSIKLIPRYSIDLLLFPKNLSQPERHNRMVELSKTRALHFQSMNFANVTNSTKQGIKVLRPVVHNFGSFYVANIEFGTPPYSELLAVDTGSNETWVQGERCHICFPLIVGNFKYQESMTYNYVHCDHPICVPRICQEDKCIFDRRYFDGSHTTGYLSGETFKFPTSEGAYETYENLIFGVGLFNENIQFSRYMGESNKVAGIFGLGPGERSILKQLKDDTDLRFSYCLSDWIIEQNPFTYLHFGSDAQISGNDQAIVQRTPLLPSQNHYNVEVLSIWLDGRKLRIDPAELQVRGDSSGGIIIDSGTTITLLVPNAYNTIRNAIVRYLRAYNWSPMANIGMMYDLCYNVQPTEYQPFPPLAIKFLGAKLEIGSHKLFKSVYENVYCLTIIPTSEQGVNILGAIHQINYRFLFDVGTSEMFFVPELCQFN